MMTLLMLAALNVAHADAPAYEIRQRPYGSCVTGTPRTSALHAGDLIIGPGDPQDEAVRVGWGRSLRSREGPPVTVEVMRDRRLVTVTVEHDRPIRVRATFEEQNRCEDLSRELASEWRSQERADQRAAEEAERQLRRTLATSIVDSEWTTAPIVAAFIEQEDAPEIYARQAIAGPDAPVVIVVNGGPGKSHDHLRVMEKLTEDGWTVVFYDQRGTGLSAEPTNRTEHDFEHHAADLDAVREWAGAERVALIGHSWGGPVVLDYAIRYPEHTLGVVTVGSGAADREHARMRDSTVLPEATPETVEGIREQLSPSCSDWAEGMAHYYASAGDFEPHHLAGTCHRSTGRQVWASIGEYDLRPGMSEIVAPVLVWYGATDPLWPNRPHIVDALSQAPVVDHLEPDCGHRPMFQCPDRFYPVLVPFLDGLEP